MEFLIFIILCLVFCFQFFILINCIISYFKFFRFKINFRDDFNEISKLNNENISLLNKTQKSINELRILFSEYFVERNSDDNEGEDDGSTRTN